MCELYSKNLQSTTRWTYRHIYSHIPKAFHTALLSQQHFWCDCGAQHCPKYKLVQNGFSQCRTSRSMDHTCKHWKHNGGTRMETDRPRRNHSLKELQLAYSLAQCTGSQDPRKRKETSQYNLRCWQYRLQYFVHLLIQCQGRCMRGQCRS